MEDMELNADTGENQSEEKNKKEKRKFINKTAVVSVILGVLVGAGGMMLYKDYSFYSEAKGIYSKIGTVKYVLDHEFLYDYDEDELADMAAYGMTAGLEDPYTIYYPEKEFSAYTDDGNGDFVGVGITVVADREKNVITIEDVTEGGPAQEAGIRAGDVLVAVNDEGGSVLKFTEAVRMVRGLDEDGKALGGEVKLTIERDGEKIDYNIVREKLHTKSVEFEMKGSDTGYIRISGFNRSDGETEDTFEEFKGAFDSLKADGAEKLIIDLRDNGGGDLQAVKNIADMLLPKGVLMYTEDKNGKRQYIYSDENEVNMPMAVLVNGNSASASELLTGTLKDYEKATVVGEKTYGKGVMQSVFPLSDGSGMVVTIAKYYTPKGICVQDTGIEPDITVEGDKTKSIQILTDEEDVQLQKAMEVLNG